MPTNRTRQPRERQAGLQSWIRYCGNEFRDFLVPDDPWTRESARVFYDKNKDAILRAINERNKASDRPFFRPDEFWEDLEATHPRARLSNSGYLYRLELLEPWEKEIFEAEKK
jgi:hypothetical protein